MSPWRTEAEFWGDRQAVYLALLSVPTVTFNLLFVSSVQVFSEARQRSREQEFMKERNENAFAYYQLAMENERRLSAVRHDLSNVLQTAFALVRNGREREGEALLQEFSAGFPRPLRYCDNEIINTVLAVKLQKIRQLPGGADADVHVTGPFGRLPLTDMQLTAVLNNLLDNAIEALAAYRESGKTDGRIGIRIGIRQGYFVINVRNPALPAAAEKGWFVKSSKRDAENHGLGLRIIREIAERAGGEFVITVSGRVRSAPPRSFRCRKATAEKSLTGRDKTGKKAPCLRIAVRQDALLRIFASDRLFFLSSASSAQKTDGDADGKPHGRRTDPAQTECGEREQTADALQNGR